MPLLVPLSRIKKRLGVELNICKHDRALLDIYTASVALLEQELGEPITEAEQSFYFTGRGCCEMNLPFRRVNSVISVHERGEVGEDDEEIDGDDYDLYPYEGGYVLRHKHTTGVWEANVEYVAVFAMGYATLPNSLSEAIIEQIREFVVNSNLPDIGRGRCGVANQVEVVGQTEPADDGSYAIGRVEMSGVCALSYKLIESYKKIRYWGM